MHSGERLCETLSKTTRMAIENNDDLYRKMRLQEEEMERSRDVSLVKELDNWLPPSVKMKRDEEELKEKQREQMLEQRRKKVLAQKTRPPSGKTKKK